MRGCRRGSGRSFVALAAVATALVCATALTGCTGSGTAEESARPTGAIDAATSAADVAWASGMAVHHDQAVALANLAEGRASDPDVIETATRIAVSQAAEATALRSWLETRGADPASHHDEGGEPMPGEISATTLDRAKALTGEAFDRLFVETMIRHHEGAVEMCETRLAASGDPAITRWARTVESSQSIEIDRMREIEDRLGTAPTSAPPAAPTPAPAG